MELTLRARCWIKFCKWLAKVINSHKTKKKLAKMSKEKAN